MNPIAALRYLFLEVGMVSKSNKPVMLEQMHPTNDRISKRITWLLAILLIISCGISILHNDIYQDGAWANAQWLGQDVITLFLVVPFLLTAARISQISKYWYWIFVWTGCYFYLIYTYSFFLFAAELTFIYLFHLPIFTLAFIGFFRMLLRLFNGPYSLQVRSKALKWSIAVYLIVIAILLFVLWMSDILSHLLIDGHQSDVPGGKAPLIIYSLDLAVVVPLMIVAVTGYFRDRQYGFILTGVMLVKSTLMGFALMSMTVSMYFHQFKLDMFLVVLWFVIGLVGLFFTVIYLRRIRVQYVAG